MKNGLRIDWSEEAVVNLESIISYLETHWTNRELKNFAKSLDEQLKIISFHPKAFPSSNKRKNVHRCVMSKLTSIYYTIDSDRIILLSLFDNRMNPDKLKI